MYKCHTETDRHAEARRAESNCLPICMFVCPSVCLSVCRNAQVAVLDTYTGEAKAALLLANSTGRSLPFKESLLTEARRVQLGLGWSDGMPGRLSLKDSGKARSSLSVRLSAFRMAHTRLGNYLLAHETGRARLVLTHLWHPRGHPQRRKCRLEDPCSFHCGERRKRLACTDTCRCLCVRTCLQQGARGRFEIRS